MVLLVIQVLGSFCDAIHLCRPDGSSVRGLLSRTMKMTLVVATLANPLPALTAPPPLGPWGRFSVRPRRSRCYMEHVCALCGARLPSPTSCG